MSTSKTGRPRRPSHARRLDALGIEVICQRIECGESQAEIAASLGMPPSVLNQWLHASDERSARTREAMQASAEGWLDRGLAALVLASTSEEVHRARAIEQHCARRAAIRNPARYGDRRQVQHSGSMGLESLVVMSEMYESPPAPRALPGEPLPLLVLGEFSKSEGR